MSTKILCVDDDASILAAYQRNLRKQFPIDVALGGQEGLDAMANKGPYAVIVADMQMPGMNGVQFLTRAEEIAPDTVRIMLTGNADQKTAADAVNQGHVFRFLTKPCAPEELALMLSAALKQYRLVTAERELLEKTLDRGRFGFRRKEEHHIDVAERAEFIPAVASKCDQRDRSRRFAKRFRVMVDPGFEKMAEEPIHKSGPAVSDLKARGSGAVTLAQYGSFRL